MGSGVRYGMVLLVAATLTACSGSGSDPEPSVSPSSSASQTSSPAAGAFPWPAAPASALPADRTNAMATTMKGWVDQGLLTGATAAVVSPAGTWTAAVGVDGRGAQLEPSSGMAIGELTQTFVAAEALLLAEQGKLDLDAPASTYLPLPQLANGATTRQLLGHRASIPDPGQGPYAAVYTAPDAIWTPQQFLAPVPKASTPPNGKFYFDTTNYVLAGLVLEKVTGQSIASAVDTDLWTPHGLERLAFQIEQTLPEPIAAPGDDERMPAGQSGRPYLPFRSWASAIAASHGVAGDAASTARWAYDLYGGHVLTRESVDQMLYFDQDVDPGFGLAAVDFTQPRWFQYQIDGYGVRSGSPGYRSVLAVYPEQQLSVVILTPTSADVLPYVRILVAAGKLID